MSTRSAIIIKDSAKKYRGVYCHSDGYETGVGVTLLEYYSNPAKVKALISLGFLSCLEAEVAPTGPHGFDHDKRQANVTVAYHRDRGEPLELATGTTLKAVEDQIGHNGFVYLYDLATGSWTCNGEPLAEAVEAARKAEAAG